MGVGIFMEYDKEVVQFPVNPEEIKIKIKSKHETQEVVSLGDVSIPKDVGLSEIEFESFYPEQNNYPFILTNNQFKAPKFYIDFIEKIRHDKKPVRFIVSDTNINLLALISEFEYGYKFGDNDVYYKLSLAEYREYQVKSVVIKQTTTTTEKPPAPTQKKVTTGCNVIVNGRLHRDSYGKGPGKTLKAYQGKVNFIKNGRSHPYHVTTTSGSWLGWVTASSVKVK